ncbi:MAG: PD-(D/E)XK nuclease family protein, partial [Gammaproteobacteria bacterium]|nr:PD-(D/E)XK nuclease family protein [Gammaproteobacteria bacterium]
LREQAPRRQPLDSWAEFFSGWLARLGWPGGRPLVSEEFQAVEAFRGLLDELTALGAVTGRVGFEQALSLLLGLAEDHIFQPRAAAAPVQILGALESGGLTFDKLWVTGLDDKNWPPRPEPHPFLPVALQRHAGLPQASPEGQLELARLRLANWLESADEVVLSCARLAGDEPLRPSPLISAVPPRDDAVDGDSDPIPFAEYLQSEAPVLEHVDDERGPALGDTHIGRGGAALIRDQAACPFRAFARWRLGARAVPIAASPLDARVRGNLVHAVLFDFWSEIGSHAALVALPAATLRGRVSQAVERVLEQERRVRPDTLRGTIVRVERERLCRLMEEWLSLEKNRAPFRVAAGEENFEAALGPLNLRIRPDRVDRLDCGEYFVVDYKTGRPQVKDWFGERPDDPQLAVYTLVFESSGEGGEVCGAAYATLRRGGLGFAGLAAEAGLAEGVVTVEASRVEAARAVPDWKSLKVGWRKSLDVLAASFASGEAQVDPKSPYGSCSYCEVKPFCRIFEQRPNVMVESQK